jgi:adenylylsulfate kinase
MLAKSDVIVLASFVSPYESIRDEIGSIIAPYKFDIVHVNTPVEYCEKRDVKGMYKMAREGKIKDFTGVSDPFEDPVAPTVRIDTSHCSVEAALNKVRSAVGL